MFEFHPTKPGNLLVDISSKDSLEFLPFHQITQLRRCGQSGINKGGGSGEPRFPEIGIVRPQKALGRSRDEKS